MFFPAFIFITFLIAVILAKPSYNVSFVEVDWNVTTTNNFDMEWQIIRLSRGVYALTGFADFKEDINTDNGRVFCNIYYSTNGVSYMLTPFRYPPAALTDGFNVMYKEYFMDTATDCCENAIYFEDKLVPPITKRRMICRECVVNTNNFPTHMRMGYYRLEAVAEKEMGFALTILMKFERE